MDKKIIAENIRTLRKAFSETQLFLAEKVCHVDRTLINKWESGARTPDPECIKTIATHYGVDADIFVSKYIRAEMDWNSGRITVTVEGQGEDEAENAFVNSIDMTPYLIEGFSEGKKTVQRVLIIPRIGIGREKVYEVYKRAYLHLLHLTTNMQKILCFHSIHIHVFSKSLNDFSASLILDTVVEYSPLLAQCLIVISRRIIGQL